MNITPTRRTLAYKLLALLCICALGLCWWLRGPQTPRAHAQAQTNYKNFEAPQVHPLALTPDGTRLLALDTPEQRLEVYGLNGSALTLTAEIPVGVEPTSVAVRNNNEAWVANWLSDSVSVVDLNTGNVTRTIDVGDEPTDIVFAGQQKELAFVCVSGLRQVKVYDPNAPDVAPQIITVRGQQPRALTRDEIGAQVFVSIFESGNQTTIIDANMVAAGGGPPAPAPALRAGLPPAPNIGLILKWNGSRWADETGDTRWHNFVPYTLADVDVVALDARGANVTQSAEIRGVGTNIGNAVFDASRNRLYVVNLDARNQVRFESNVRGRFLQQRISLVNLQTNPASQIAIDLNPHINYSNAAGTDAERAKTLAFPADIARAADGTLYIAATGSNKVGVLNAAGSVRQRINVGQGPTGLALDDARKRLYVLNRFDETISVVDTDARTELTRVPLGFNPEPAQVREGRRFLYEGSFSAHGDLACASCHLNGHRDGLAWDLGDPQGQMQQVVSNNPLFPFVANLHPMKGPMTTQTLRGIISANPQQTTEPLHWRGDRAGFNDFNPAFVSLLGGQRQLNGTELAAFTALVRTLSYPPNPNENLDRTLPNPATGANAARGAQLFQTARLDANALTCNQCHATQPGFGTGTNRLLIPAAALAESQDFKVPQLRGLYQKTGLQRAPGEQLAGYGFAHDGNFDSLFSFLHAQVFTFQSDQQRRDVEAFVMAFDTGTAPAVGLQVTVNASNKTAQAVTDRVNLLVAQAGLRNCDLIVKGIFNGQRRGFVYNSLAPGLGSFQSDRSGEPIFSPQALIQAADAGAELTFTGVPVGAGRRLGIDRNEDGVLDGDAQPGALNISGQITAINGSPVGGVTITVNGPAGTLNAQTDANGRYAFTNLAGGAYTITPARNGYTFAPASQSLNGLSGDAAINFVAPSTVQFSASNYSFSEDAGQATINVTRTGDTSTPASVAYFTADNTAAVRCDDTTTLPGAAFARCDYATSVDTINFAPGETSKTFTIPLIDDAHAEGPENVTLKLSDPAGATLGTQSTTTLTITDNDGGASANPVFTDGFFVRQQYLDFLSREPETDGFNAWTGVLNRCADVNNLDPNSPAAGCDRILVSSSFFGSPEFQLKGVFVYLFYKVSFNRLPAYDEIIPDMRGVTGQTGAEVFQKKAAFTDAWLERPEFVALYPNTLTDAQYVASLLTRYGLTSITTPDPANPDGTQLLTLAQTDLVNRLNTGTLTRAQVLRAVVQSREVNVAEFNRAFVAMQYYGYLRRTPEDSGYQSWLTYLTTHPGDFRTMVNGFMNSPEYRLRFGRPQ